MRGYEDLKLLVMPRSRGKSSRLIDWMVEKQEEEVRIGVFVSPELAMQALRLAREICPSGQPLESWQFVSHQEIRAGNRGAMWSGVHRDVRRRMVLGIDEIGLLLQDMLRAPAPIALGTITCDLEVVTSPGGGQR